MSKPVPLANILQKVMQTFRDQAQIPSPPSLHFQYELCESVLEQHVFNQFCQLDFYYNAPYYHFEIKRIF